MIWFVAALLVKKHFQYTKNKTDSIDEIVLYSLLFSSESYKVTTATKVQIPQPIINAYTYHIGLV